MIAKKIIRGLAQHCYSVDKSYRIPFGPARGLKLVYTRSTQYHCMAGLYDRPILSSVNKALKGLNLLKPGWIAADIGANIGYFTVWLADLCRKTQGRQVYSFEPEISNIQQINKNIEANDLSSYVTVVEQAVTGHDGYVNFFYGGSLAEGGTVFEWSSGGRPRSEVKEVKVRSTTLDSFFAKPGNDKGYPIFLKIDIEGGGVTALEKMDKCFSIARPLCLMESHTGSEDLAIARLLTRNKFAAVHLKEGRWLSKEATCKTDGGIHDTMLLVPVEMARKLGDILKIPYNAI